MFKIDNKTKQISITRGDVALINFSTLNGDGSEYVFQANDVVRFKVFERKESKMVHLIKDFKAIENQTSIEISLTSEDTKIGELIDKPRKYWYEIELNPDTNPQTLIGYDDEGEKLFILYPEGGDKE